MQTVCPNPGCGAAYTLSPQHLGRQFICRKCGATLLAEAQGLRLVAGAPAAQYAEAGTSQAEEAAYNTNVAAASSSTTQVQAPARKAGRRAGFGQPMLTNLLSDPVTLAFTIGAIIVIVLLFMPILDAEKVGRKQASIGAGVLTQQRLDREAAQKLRDGAHPSSAELDEAKKRRETWEKEKTGLEEEAEQAKIDADYNRYWYTWGTLIGFLVLAVAALGYMSPEQTTIRKVTGCIITCAILLLIFFRMLAK